MSADEPTPDPIDLSALGPRLDATAFDARIAAILRASAPELSRRQQKPTLALVVVQWRRPVLSFAGLAAAAAVALFVMPQRGATSTTVVASAGTMTSSNAANDSSSVALLLGVPTEYAAAVEGAAVTTTTRSTP
jgi:hypothetical protein